MSDLGTSGAVTLGSLILIDMFSGPGGYLQWDEADLATWGARVPSETVSAVNAEEAFRRLHRHLAESGLDFRYVHGKVFVFQNTNSAGLQVGFRPR